MKNFLRTCVILCVVYSFNVAASAANNSIPEGKPDLQGEVSGQDRSQLSKPTVGVYYYPWYHESSFWRSHKWDHAMRLLLKHPQKPKAGLYDSRDAEVIGEHISQSVRGGIGMWAVSWWGPHGSKDAVLKNHILKHPDAGKLKYAILYESTGRLGSFKRPRYRNWLRDMDYLNKTYFNHPYYYKIDGRPVVFVYLSREYFRNKGHDVLAEMRKKFPQIYLVGDDVFAVDNNNEYQASWAEQFDAVTAYDVYGQSVGRFGGTKKAVDFLAATYRNAKTAANSVGTAFMPTIAPGYNDTAVRKGHPGRARYFTDVKDSKEGDIFRAMIDKVAFPNLDPTCGNVMMITSFNEWYEDSQIEATSGKAPPSDTDKSRSKTYYTGGQTYNDYEYLYLDILRGAVNSYGKLNATAPQYHVSVNGADGNPGTESKPFKTIMAAAKIAQPGDTITVHEGTYRESIKPPHGGTSDKKRIVYQAAPGEKVTIKGSEIIKGWKQVGSGVWKAELANSFFGDYNPYALILTGDWLAYGKWHHRGDVYLNGKAFLEKQNEDEVGQTSGSWFCRTDEKTTTIIANFGKSNPNKETVEINVRHGLFIPEITGLKYITVDGFHFLHDASNWAAPNRFQPGAVGTWMGKRWIIQNCTITDCRCVGIILGKAPGIDFTDIDAYGDHIVRNNIIRRCGQSGIAGYRGATRSLIEGNLIEDTNYRSEFGGQETSAIKFHFSVDTIIKNNLIRRVNEKKDNHGAGGIGGFGIWIDANNQSFRVTGNIVYDTELEPLFFEMNHGPILVDNNIIAGEGVKCIRSNSDADVFAHNLFVDCGYLWTLNNERIAHYYKPHTTKVVGRKAGAPADNKWYNNIFVRSGLNSVKKAEGYQSDYNLFLEGAKKSTFGDEHSIVDAHVTEFTIDERPNGVTITFSAGNQQRQLEGPWVNGKLVGVFATSGQTIEDRYANPITVDTDIIGEKRSRPTVGPLANLKSGSNSISWVKGKIKK